MAIFRQNAARVSGYLQLLQSHTMEIRFRPTEEDGLKAMRATSMPTWGMSLFVLLLSLLFLVGVFLIDHDLPVAGWLWLALSTAIGIAVYEVPRIQVRRSLRDSPSAQGEIVVVLDGEGTLTTFPTGESRLSWAAYTKYKETGSMFLLFVSPHRCLSIPKRAMTPQQIEELRSLVKARVTR
jgi:cation transport ATPase